MQRIRSSLFGLCIVLTTVLSIGTVNAVNWSSFAFSNQWQYDNGVIAGEGFQQVWDIDWNPRNTSILYLVSDTTNVWRSTNSGNSWSRIALDVAPKGGSTIVSDPRNESIVFYLADKMFVSTYYGNLTGLYRSTDYGDTFTEVLSTNVTRNKHGKTILFDNTSNFTNGALQTIYIGTMAGLQRSTDGGITWISLSNTDGYEVYDLEWIDEGKSIFIITNTSLYVFNVTRYDTVGVSSGLVMNLSYDDANTAWVYDYGRGYNATNVSGLAYSNDIRGTKALNLSGTAYVNFSDNSRYDMTTGLTFMTWINPLRTGGGLNNRSVMLYSGGNGYIFRLVNPTGTTYIGAYLDGVTSLTNDTLCTVDVGVWTHIAYVYDEVNLIVYKNGSLCANVSAALGNIDNNNGNINLGYQFGTNRFVNGSMDNTKMYNTSLSSSQVFNEYITGLPVFQIVGGGLPGTAYDAVVSRTTPSIIYVTSTNGIYKSIDTGMSFASNSTGLNTGVGYRHISMSSVNKSRMFTSPNLLGGNKPYYSLNGGVSWSQASDVNAEQVLYSAYYYAEPIIWMPGNDSIAITSRSDQIMKTYDYGNSWNYSGSGYRGANVNDIRFIDENTSIWCLTDYGIWMTTNARNVFSHLNETGIGSDRTCGGIDYNGSRIIATYGSWDNQDIIASDNLGVSWSTILVASYSFNFLRYNPNNSSIIYADYNYSLDGGVTWSSTGGGYRITALDPFNNNAIYGVKDYGSVNAIGKSIDNGASWVQLGGNLSFTDIKSMAVNPYNTTLHIIVTQSSVCHYRPSSNWTCGGSTNLPTNSFENYEGILFDKTPGVVWVGLFGYLYHGRGIFRSTNYGINWTNVSDNLGDYWDVRRIFQDSNTGSLYASSHGVYEYYLKSDSCSCPGANINWIINLADSCNITSACDLQNGNLSFTGSGYMGCNATLNVSRTSRLDPGVGNIVYVYNKCLVI